MLALGAVPTTWMVVRPRLVHLAALGVLGAGCAASEEPSASALPAACQVRPAFPVPATPVEGPPPSEDFTFDQEGFVLALLNGHSLVRAARGAQWTMVHPNVVVNGRGLRVLPGGGVVIADRDRALLVLIDPAVGLSRLTTTIIRPNGIELGPGGQLFVSDFGASGDIYRVDPKSGAAEVITQPGPASNGLAFSLDQRTLFVGDHDAGALSRVPLQAAQAPLPAERWITGLGKPDGLATDACGNIYVASWDGRVYRVTPAGEVDTVADLGTAVSAVGFGSGEQGWDAHSLYAMAVQQGLFELPLGIGGAPASSR